MKLLIKNGRVIDPSSALDDRRDVLLEGGKVQRVESNIGDYEESVTTVIDASEFVVAPGFVDIHVHLREPGREDEETLASGSEAAAAGGFTAVACMPDTHPPNDSRGVTEMIVGRAGQNAKVRVFPVAAVSRGRLGEELTEIGDLYHGGAIAVSDAGRPIRNSEILRRALEYTQLFDIPVIDHCEDSSLATGVMHEGYYSTILGLRGIPAASEEIIVGRDIALAKLTGGKLHLAHLSAGGSIERLRRAREEGVRVSAEVTPHHFSLTDEAVLGFDTQMKVNPPLRSDSDQQAILEAIADGTIDAVASDHAPHATEEKLADFDSAPFGIIGLETSVSLALDRLYHRGIVSLSRLIELYTTGPAASLNLPVGSLAPGSHADVTLLDVERDVEIDLAHSQSLSRNSPFHGWKLKGGPVMTIVAGEVVWSL